MKSQFESAIITEQGKKIAVVSVQPAVLHNATDANMVIKALIPTFNGVPVVLVTKNKEGAPAYYGRSDLVLLLENTKLEEASWSQLSAEIDLTNTACPSQEGIKIDTK
ncbi:MAG TPA: hypothetical protein DD730_11310 [Desulfosporosinus sp.]|nr:hypothetical protein [Desulfosporosinus sp.]